MIIEMIKAFFFIFIAEMGDKTQILAMAFATRYKVQKVLWGVLIGSFLNHGLAVILGAYMSNVVPVELIQFVAACAFILFGLWALKYEEEEEEKAKKEKFGPVVTVALTFFIGELGDKTQLAAITLSTTAQYPAFILMGTVLGMVVTSSIGIFIGSKLGKRIPELAIKIISGFIFIFFGILGLFEMTPVEYKTPLNLSAFFILLSVIVFILLKPSIQAMRTGKISAFRKTAAELHKHVREMRNTVDKICLGEHSCGKCQGKDCGIGFLKEALLHVNEQGVCIYPDKWHDGVDTTEKAYDMDRVIEGLTISVMVSEKFGKTKDKHFIANKAREIFELICFREKISFEGDVKAYFSLLNRKNKVLSERIVNQYNILKEVKQCQETEKCPEIKKCRES